MFGDDEWTSGYDLAGGGDSSAGFDFAGTLGKVGGVLGNVATSIIGLQSARETAAYQRQIAGANRDLELAKVQGAVDVEKLRAAAAVREQNRLLNSSPLLGSFYPFPTSGNRNMDTLMLILTAAGVYLGWKALKK